MKVNHPMISTWSATDPSSWHRTVYFAPIPEWVRSEEPALKRLLPLALFEV